MTGIYQNLGAGLVLAALALGAVYGAYQQGMSHADERWKQVWADQQLLQAKALAAATASNRNEEQRRQMAANQVANEAREESKVLVGTGVAADTMGQRVRDTATELAARSGCPGSDSGTTDRSQAATRAAMVLSDLFQRADKRAGELAKAYDAARLAGLTCERSYHSLSAVPST